mgnify:CR=1 FL=1
MNLEIGDHWDEFYYTVEIMEDHLPDDPWYHRSFPNVDTWCAETFGDQDRWGDEPVTGWKRMRNTYFFTEKSKMDWFVVKWS